MNKVKPITQRAKSSPFKLNPAMAVIGAYQQKAAGGDFTNKLDLPEPPAPSTAVPAPGKEDVKPTPEMCKQTPTLEGCEAANLDENQEGDKE